MRDVSKCRTFASKTKRLLVAGTVALCCASCGDSGASADYNNYDVRAVGWAQNSIKAVLRDPDSFEWNGYQVYHGREGLPIVVCGHFHAKNGFGGYNDGYAAVALILAKDGDFDNSPVDLNPSRKLWKQLCRDLPANGSLAAKTRQNGKDVTQ
ncbi:MAG: hypothetical protein ACREHF_00285 [Rhizomicrobium sp.]